MKKFLSLLIICNLLFSLNAMIDENDVRELTFLMAPAELIIAYAQFNDYAQFNYKIRKEIESFSTALIVGGYQGKIAVKDVKSILGCVAFAAEKHQHQTRKDVDKTPYIIHPLGVARAIIEDGKEYDADVIKAALLHDTIEDTQTTFEEIETNFGSTVCNLVREVTEDKKLTRPERKQWWIDTAAQKSSKAGLIILADKTYNMLDERPADWDQKRVDEYFTWCHKVITKLPVNDNHPLKKRALDIIQKHFTD